MQTEQVILDQVVCVWFKVLQLVCRVRCESDT
jgi:hypothetical protein